MKQTSAIFHRSSRLSIAHFAVLGGLVVAQPATAQGIGMVDPSQSLNWQPGAINHAQQMRREGESETKTLHDEAPNDTTTGSG